MRPMPGLTNDEHRSVIHEGPLRLLEKQGKVMKITCMHFFHFILALCHSKLVFMQLFHNQIELEIGIIAIVGGEFGRASR